MKISIANYSQIDKKVLRMEAEFYTSNSLLNTDVFLGEEIVDFVQYGTSKKLNEEGRGFPTLRLNEFDSIFIEKPRKFCDRINSEQFNTLQLQKNDILICRTNGNPRLVGKCAIVPTDCIYAFASYLYRLRPDCKKILPTTLVIYLNSKVGRAEIEKYSMQSNQTNFSPAKFREIWVPKFGDDLQLLIKNCVWKAFKYHQASNDSYQSAQEILSKELASDCWHFKHQLTFVKNYSDTDKLRRIDAEYFQPKYDEVVEIAQRYTGGWDALKNLVTINDKNFSPEDEKKYQYIELANITKNGGVADCMIEKGGLLPTRARRNVSTDNLVVSSIEGSLSSIALIDKNYDQALCSTGFHVIKSEVINSESLLILLKSLVGQLQLKKGCSGTILSAIEKREFGDIILPKIKNDLQANIQKIVRKAFTLKKQQELVLERAKNAIEIAAKQNEKIAIEWLKDEKNVILNRL